MKIFLAWAVYDKENKEYPGFYLVRLFIWQTPTDNFFISSDIEDIRWWVGENNKNNGNNKLKCRNPPPKPFPNLLEVWA